jgi:hypothetical protein
MNRFFKSKSISSKPKHSPHEPPVRVIKAQASFVSNDKSKISFKEGDYFYVSSLNKASPNQYYVVNPLTNVSGYVDSKYFEIVEKSQPPSPPVEKGMELGNRPSTQSMPQRAVKAKYQKSNSTALTKIITKKGSFASVLTTDTYSSPMNYGEGFSYDVLYDSSRAMKSPLSMTTDGGSSLTPVSALSIISLNQVEHISVAMDMYDMYSITLKFQSGRCVLIHRSCTELYDMHLQLLEMFPSYAGANAAPRMFPYFVVKSDDDTAERDIELYLLESMKLPGIILNSRLWNGFLNLRPGDEELADSEMHDENMILSYIEEYTKPTIIKVKISIAGGQTYSFKTEPNASQVSMIRSLESRLNHKIVDLSYRNELKQLIKIHGDRDLHLLFRTCPNPILHSE